MVKSETKAVETMLEIEKKLLLKKLPRLKYSELLIIEQSYGPKGRFRKSVSNKTGKTEYIHTIKKSRGKGVNEEYEQLLDEKTFNKEIKKCTRIIKKYRYIFKHDGYKWEIDLFNDICLVIAEVEVRTKKELKTVKIPKKIADQLIIDVTGEKRFSNFNLSDKIIKERNVDQVKSRVIVPKYLRPKKR